MNERTKLMICKKWVKIDTWSYQKGPINILFIGPNLLKFGNIRYIYYICIQKLEHVSTVLMIRQNIQLLHILLPLGQAQALYTVKKSSSYSIIHLDDKQSDNTSVEKPLMQSSERLPISPQCPDVVYKPCHDSREGTPQPGKSITLKPEIDLEDSMMHEPNQ